MLRVLVVVGTRPEAIKLAPLCLALRADDHFELEVCATSQHGTMLLPMLEFFGVRPDHDLKVMQAGQTLADVTTRVLDGISALLARGRYDVIVVQGDTTTVFAASLAAFYARVPVAHVEAGLRSGDLASPFPEEANRRLADVLSRWLFAPTNAARDHLVAEGYSPESVFVTGNTGIDALLLAAQMVKAAPHSQIVQLPANAKLVLVTAHRRESFGEGFEGICRGLLDLVAAEPSVHLVYPVHPNPNVTATVEKRLAGHDRIHLVPPLDYPDFVQLLTQASLVLTDSGGVQEEAPALGRRTLVMRDTTERPEGVTAGVAELVGTDPERITRRARALLTLPSLTAQSPYGDGQASSRIVEVLKTGALMRPFGV